MLLSLTSTETHEPLRTLSNHRAAITSLSMGHSASTANICVSASKDNTVIVWNYNSGLLLRTFLLQSTPLCLAVDPCDRGVFIGFEDGSIQLAEFTQPESLLNPLYDSKIQSTPVQISIPPFVGPSETGYGSALCLGLNYDGTRLLSGHASGKIAQWDTGRKVFSMEIADLNAPVTNILMLSPFPPNKLTKAIAVVKPKLAEGNYTFTAQLTGTLGSSHLDEALEAPGFPLAVLESAISRFSAPVATSSSDDEQLRKDNENLRKVVSEQQALLKKLIAKQNKTKA